MNTEKSKKIMLLISAVNALLILLCAAGCLYICFAGNGLYYIVTSLTELLALSFSVVYFTRGFKKDAAAYYRLFMLFYAFTYLVEIAAGIFGFDGIGVESKVSATLLFSMLLYGNTLILAVGKDLGKKVALTLCGVNVFAYLLPVLGLLIPDMIVFESDITKASSIILYVTWLTLALNALIMTVAKYTDKAMRGTK